MNKFFRMIAGKKFYCDEKGLLIKDAEGNFKEMPESDTTTPEFSGNDEGLEEVKSLIEKATEEVKNKASQDLASSQVKAVESIEKLFDKIAESANKSISKVSINSQVKASFDVEAVQKGLKNLAERQRNTFSFEIKSTKDLDFLVKATSESGSLTDDVIEGQRVPEITRDPVRSPFIEQIADVTANMTSDHLSYVEVVSESGAPLRTDELASLPEKDFEFQEYKSYLKKIGVTNKHSVEILSDAPQLVNAIKGWLQEDVNIVTDDQLLNGSGIGQNLSGVFTVASALDDTEIGTKRVEDANLYDVIRVAITKIAVYGKGKYSANYVLLNPEDADALDLTKDLNGQYILPPFRSADGMMIKGARVIENVGVPVGEFLVGDFRKLHIGTKGGVTIEMTNSDGNDFNKDILTVKMTRRIASYVRQNDSGAFWTGNIQDVIDALTAGLS